MDHQPKVLLVEVDTETSEALQYISEGFFDIQVEPTVEHAINRVGFETFDLVVLNSKFADLTVMKRVMQFFRKLQTPIMLFGEKPQKTNGYPILTASDRGKFVDRVSDLLDVSHV